MVIALIAMSLAGLSGLSGLSGEISALGDSDEILLESSGYMLLEDASGYFELET